MPSAPHQARMAQLDKIRARAAAAPAGEAEELRLVLGELDRRRELFDECMERNGALIDALTQVHHVTIHPFAGTFCRTCSAEVEGTRDGCARHSPTRVVRTLLTQYAELHARFTVLLDGPDPEQDTPRRMQLVAERDRRAHQLLADACQLLGPAMAPEHPSATADEGHRPGCAPFDCRCGCPREQTCPDCRRCVCWPSACCAGEPGTDAPATALTECATCGDTGCRDQQAGSHVFCALCKWPHGEHRFVECDTFTAEETAAEQSP